MSHRLCVAGIVLLACGVIETSAGASGATLANQPAARPNILWLTCEDTGPHLGAYGDKYATTPHLDAFAKTALRYRTCWSNAPVCAPARTTIISGIYPPSTGSEHMRSQIPYPTGLKMYPQHLKEAGYYCTNNSKEDYNLAKPDKVWDESSPKAHWKNRAKGQPFFAIFNDTVTHESQIRRKGHKLVHDPQQVRLPAYHPNTPESRRDWAQYYDNITTMDSTFGAKLAELREAGLADNTIVFFYGDHGSGMPRGKRTACDSGLHVPLLIHVPEKFRALAPGYQPGGVTERLVSFVDLAPTLLSLVGVKPPASMQGEPFLGPHATAPRQYVFGFRGRMDERYDFVRSCRDQRYVYVRNYLPHLPHGQHVEYQFETPTTRVWKSLFDQGKLTPEQAQFWQPRVAEELYDLETDPDEVRNLAASPAHREILERMRTAQRGLARSIRDVGFLPESELHLRSTGTTPYDMGRRDADYPYDRIADMAELASFPDNSAKALSQLRDGLGDRDAAVRYWSVMGFLTRGKSAVEGQAERLRSALGDPSPLVRMAAAETLGRLGSADDLARSLPVLKELLDHAQHGPYITTMTINVIDHLDGKAASLLSAVKAAESVDKALPQRAAGKAGRLIRKIEADAAGR